MNWTVPFFDLQLGEEEKHAVIQVIESNWLTAGPKIAEFESEFSGALSDTAGSVAVSSATAALHLSMLALGIGSGDEVIVPSLTFVASANAIRYVGATPVFTDITSEFDWNLSPDDVESKITSRTKAIMVVHYAGYACDMDRFTEIAKKHNLFLVEDCSHAPLGTWKGKYLGTFGETGCFSFFSNKNMTTGEGGMLVSKNPELVERFRILRSHGITASTYQRFKGHAYGYDVAELGYNYRLDEIRAAIGIEQMRKLNKHNASRKERVECYRQLLAEKLPQIRIPFDTRNTDSSYHIFPVLLPEGKKLRNDVLRAMGDSGIQCSVHYRPIHTFSSYQHFAAEVPVTDGIANLIITLPLFPTMTDGQIELVVNTLSKCI